VIHWNIPSTNLHNRVYENDLCDN